MLRQSRFLRNKKRWGSWEESGVKKEAMNLTSLKHGEDEGVSAAKGMSSEVSLVPCAVPGVSSRVISEFSLATERVLKF